MDINQYFGAPFSKITDVGTFVGLILNIVLIISGLIILFYFILGGIGMISSAGKNDPKAAEEAKAKITSAIMGFVIVFVAYWIVKLIGSLLHIIII